MPKNYEISELMHYLAALSPENGEERLPALSDLSKELDLSVSVLREQLEVAKALGLVDVRPRTGIRRLPYTFLPAVRQSLAYAIEVDERTFGQFADVRNHLEAAYWDQAVRKLLPEDLSELQALVERAWEKLNAAHIQIPHAEHRSLHLCIYRRLDNPFVLGLLEAYWEAYEAVGYGMYADYNYLKQVWAYHDKMVKAICGGDYTAGYQALVEHKDLLFQAHRPGSGIVASEH